ncbi:MAG: hypothetical protein AAF678_00405 [Pseudomonadota bacterium]
MSRKNADDVLAVVRAPAGRRILGVALMGGLGVLLVTVAITQPPANPAWLLFLIVLGGIALWLAEAMRRATSLSVELTREGLRCSDGERIALIEEIETLERGTFAFKPSNGFLMKLRTKGPSRWRPGLWWRVGARVGIGGVTAASQAKAMAEMIAALKFEQSENADR